MPVTSTRILTRLKAAQKNRCLQPLLAQLFKQGQPLHTNAIAVFNNGPLQHLQDTDADADKFIDILNERLALLTTVNAVAIRAEICTTLGIPGNTLDIVPEADLTKIQLEARLARNRNFNFPVGLNKLENIVLAKFISILYRSLTPLQIQSLNEFRLRGNAQLNPLACMQELRLKLNELQPAVDINPALGDLLCDPAGNLAQNIINNWGAPVTTQAFITAFQGESDRIDSIKAINGRAGNDSIIGGPARAWALKKLPKFINQANNLLAAVPTLDEKLIPFINKKLIENPRLTRDEFCAWLAHNSLGRNYTRGCGIQDVRYHPDEAEFAAMRARAALIAKKEVFVQRQAELQREIKQSLSIAELHVAGKPHATAYLQDPAECQRLFKEREGVLTLQLIRLNEQEEKLRLEMSLYADLERQIPEARKIIQDQLEEKAVAAGNNRASRWLRKKFAGLWSGGYRLGKIGPAVGTERDLVSGERAQQLKMLRIDLAHLLQIIQETRTVLQKEIKASEVEALKAQQVLRAFEEIKLHPPAAVQAHSMIIPVLCEQRKKHTVAINPAAINDSEQIQILKRQPLEANVLRVTAGGVVPMQIAPAVAGFVVNNNQGLPDLAAQYIQPGEKVYLNENGFVHSYALNAERTHFSLQLHDAPGGWRWYVSENSRKEYCDYFVKRALETFTAFQQFPDSAYVTFPELHDKAVESMLYEALLAVKKLKGWDIPITLPAGKEQSFKDPSVRAEMLKAARRLVLDTKPMQAEMEAVRQSLRAN